ncbi:unnamed protein product, partial [Natator depressus]
MAKSCLASQMCGMIFQKACVDSYNRPYVRQCPDSTVLIQALPAVVTFPGAIQESIVGSQRAADIRCGDGGICGGMYGYGDSCGY